MSKKVAQKIVNELEEDFGFCATAYQTSELETIMNLLEKFLDQGIETEDLQDPEDVVVDADEEEEEEEDDL